MGTLKIKRAKFYDMPTIARFIRSSADWYRKFISPKDLSEHYVDQEWMVKNYKKRDFYIGYDGKDPIGTISHQTIDDHAYLGYIYLDSKKVGKGYGKQLMDFAKSISKKKELKSMVLIAHPKATWATKAYEKYGFKCLAKKKEDVLSWNKGALKPFYEEGFQLYQYSLAS